MLHRGLRQGEGDGGQARAVLQGRLPGEQRLQLRLTGAQLALQGHHVVQLRRPVHQLPDAGHAGALRRDAAVHVHHLVGDVLGLRLPAEQLPGARQFVEHGLVTLHGHAQRHPGPLVALRVTGGGLVTDVTARVLGRGAGRGERRRRVLDLHAQGDGADDVVRGEFGRRARTRPGGTGPAAGL